MAKVYRILPDGSKERIETLDDLAELDPESEEVQLIIEDKLDGEISYDNGERYIFGGDTGPGRWVSVQGIKAWYDPSSSDTIFNFNGNVATYKESIMHQFAENLYWNLSFKDKNENLYKIATTAYTGTYSNLTWLYFDPNITITSSEENSITSISMRTNGSPLSDDNVDLQYCGYLPIVSGITNDKQVKLRFLSIGCDKNKNMMKLYYTYAYRGENVGVINPSNGGTLGYYFLRPTNGETYSQNPYEVQIPPTEMEFLYIMGLTTVYKKATYEEVQEILGGDSNE